MNRDRVVQIVAPGRVELVDVDVPALNDGEVLVRTEVSALSAGTERLVSNGAVDASFAAQNRPGYCSVGVVEAGEPSLLGARVFAFHPHQSRFVARAADVVRLPEGMSAEVATLLANTETAVSLVMDAAPVLGEVSAVVGLGIVGQLVLAIASRLQSGPVHGVDLRADRIEIAHRDTVRGKSLNELPGFEGKNPSIELFARVAAERLKPALATQKSLSGFKVVIWEHAQAWASFHQSL